MDHSDRNGSIYHIFIFLIAAVLLLSANLDAQYFGKNKVTYEALDFRILRTEHFDIYYYDDIEETIDDVGKMAERWYERLSRVLNHEFTRRQPLIIYSNHTHFRQTNASPSDIGEGTGGFTEILKNRVVMPKAGTLDEFDHVLGHELVHAFQFDMTGHRGDPEHGGRVPGATQLPLWFVEGMAEYLSVGPLDTHTAMWMRDAVLNDELPEIRRLNHPRYNPYRYGHALMSYLAGRWGDEVIGEFLRRAVRQRDLRRAIEATFEMDHEELTEQWHADMKNHYQPMLDDARPASEFGRELRSGRDHRDRRSVNLAPSLSPDGTRIVFLSERQHVALELFLMDVETGETIRRITRTAIDPHYESLQFVSSAGSWSPDGRQFLFSAVRRGESVLTIIDTESGETIREIPFPGLGEIYNPAWSPDGRSIVFSGQVRGYTDLFVFDLEEHHLERLTNDLYSALHPEWSPDGSTIAYVTDRFTTDLGSLRGGVHRIALYDVGTGEIHPIPHVQGAKQISPQWGFDGNSLFFVSDPRGTSNIYRLDFDTGLIYEITNVHTGVGGFTGLSPILSVAGPRNSIAFSVFDRGGYGLFVADDASELTVVSTEDIAFDPENAVLPPVERTRQQVAAYLAEPDRGLPREPVRDISEYRPRFTPDFITQAHIGAASGPGGTAAGGGATMYWTDMLGDHHLLTQLELLYQDGEFLRNSAAAISYENRRHRYNWGASVSQIPFVSAGFQESIGVIDNETVIVQDLTRIWQVNRDIMGRVSYPLSRASRIEAGAGYRHISFHAQGERRIFSAATLQLISDERETFPAPSSLNLFQSSVAHVYDTSVFGGTAPILGQRSRLELTGVTGDLNYYTPLVDYRAYWMPFEGYPLSLAVRGMHFGRYGTDGESPRLQPIFVGSPSLVRGYGRGFSVIADPAFDRMQGSRVAVGNVELRLPITGMRGVVGGTFGPPLDLALFYDTGTAWTSGDSFLGGGSPISSYGASLRFNLGGFFVLQLSYVNPVTLRDEGWHFQFSLTPGF